MSDTPMKLVVDLEKGTQEYIPLTPAEIAQRDQQAAAAAQAKADQDAKDQAEADAKLKAQAKLQALGLSNSGYSLASQAYQNPAWGLIGSAMGAAGNAAAGGAFG